VTSISSLLTRSNDIINGDAERMSRELVYFNHDYVEAVNAVYIIVEQITP